MYKYVTLFLLIFSVLNAKDSNNNDSLKNIEIFTNKYLYTISDKELLEIGNDVNLTSNNPIVNAIKSFQKNNNRHFKRATKESDIVGFSLEGKYDQYIYSDYINRDYTDYEYTLKLTFDLFKNGYYENRYKKLQRANSSTVLYFQNLIKLNNYNYNNNLLKLKKVLSYIEHIYYVELVKLYDDSIQREKILLENGTQTRYEVNALIYEREKFFELSKLYQKAQCNIDKDLYNLLLRIENLTLVDIDKIKESSKHNNSNILLQKARYKQLSLEKKFSDEISLKLYTAMRSMDEVGWYSTVGAEINIPLNFSLNDTNQHNKIEKYSTKINYNATLNFVNNSLDESYREFIELQKVIEIKKKYIKNLHLQLKDFKTIAKYNLPNIKVNYAQKIFITQNSIMKIKYENALDRVKLLELILKISYISTIYDVKKLIVEKKS